MTASTPSSSPFHAGEIAVQTRAGVREQIEPWARRMIRPQMPIQHQAFYASLPYLVIAARDQGGRAWASLLSAAPGFAHAAGPRTLELDAALGPADALADALQPGVDLGLLGIELATRRRNRVNGRLVEREGPGLRLAVAQSFGNCPQHIHPRGWTTTPRPASEPRPRARRGASLSASQQAWITKADTLFIASGHRGRGPNPAYGMDASHRGGPPGFVEVANERTLIIPDYSGNNHFNTLGNIVADPRVGLVFVDFETGGLLQISGRAEIDWQPDPAAARLGARRLVRFTVEAIVEQPQALALRWTDDSEALTLGIVRKTRQSDAVTSFTLISPDNTPLPAFEAGQHLPVEIDIPGHGRVARSYSLSRAPSGEAHEPSYRISVKRETHGLVSRYLHDEAEAGTLVHAHAPAGEFILAPDSARTVVLVSAGVGITPMLSMVEARARAGLAASTWFIHQARNAHHRPHAAELAALAEDHPQLRTHVAHSQPGSDEHHARDFDQRGRLDAATIHTLVGQTSATYYLCGPPAFMATIGEGLAELGVPHDAIRSEVFAG